MSDANQFEVAIIGGGHNGKTLIDSFLDTDFGKKLGDQITKSRGLRSMTQHFSKRR